MLSYSVYEELYTPETPFYLSISLLAICDGWMRYSFFRKHHWASSPPENISGYKLKNTQAQSKQVKINAD
jgi:hypothetical protein